MIPNPSFLLIVVSCDFMIHQLMAKLREYGRTHIFGYYYPDFRQTQVIDLDLPKTFKIANGSFFWGDLNDLGHFGTKVGCFFDFFPVIPDDSRLMRCFQGVLE